MKINTKTLSKVLTIIVIALMIATICGNVIAATDPKSITITANSGFDTIGGKIIGLIQGVGSVLAVGVLVVLGVKYMLGSAEEKGEYKKSMVPYIVGAVLIFAASNIASIIYNVAIDANT